MLFNKEDLREIITLKLDKVEVINGKEYTLVKKEISDTSRWSIEYEAVFQSRVVDKIIEMTKSKELKWQMNGHDGMRVEIKGHTLRFFRNSQSLWITAKYSETPVYELSSGNSELNLAIRSQITELNEFLDGLIEQLDRL